MRKSTRTIFLILLISAVFLSQSEVQSLESATIDTIPEIVNNLTDYIEHAPIIINSNDDFISYGFNGTGTTEDPYIIENYNITANAEYGIKICCSDKKYIIQNCYINLDYVSTTYAIYLEDSPEFCGVLNNTCEDNFFGLYLDHCTNMEISNNTLIGNSKGIYAFNSNQLYIMQNYCSNSVLFGFDFYDCVWIDLLMNILQDNLQDAVKFNDVQSGSISQNIFQENIGYAVFLTSSTLDIEVYLNNFIDNAELFNAQAYDSGTDNCWSNPITFLGNFWSDLGQYCYYELDGAAGSYDYYPINKELNCYTTTSPTTPTSATLAFEIVLLTLFLAIPIMHLKQKKKK